MDKILKNVTIFSSVVILIAIITLASVFSSRESNLELKFADKKTNTLVSSGTQNSDQIPTLKDGVQEVKLSVSGGQYVLTPSTLQKDVPVRMVADVSTMPGCAKSVVIQEFGVRKYLTTSDNIIEFTPTKTGVIAIACSMNMYRGSFTVVNSDGTVDSGSNTQIQSTPSTTSGGGCTMGAGGGGCGCGG